MYEAFYFPFFYTIAIVALSLREQKMFFVAFFYAAEVVTAYEYMCIDIFLKNLE